MSHLVVENLGKQFPTRTEPLASASAMSDVSAEVNHLGA